MCEGDFGESVMLLSESEDKMYRQVLHSKIHDAVVTEAVVEYVGSITIDQDLLDAANICAGEKVLIANLANGSRLESYAMVGKRGSKVICLNGGAALHGKPGDQIILMTFAVMTDDEIKKHQPTIIRLNEKNEIIK